MTEERLEEVTRIRKGWEGVISVRTWLGASSIEIMEKQFIFLRWQ